jgi:hypothetical protein
VAQVSESPYPDYTDPAEYRRAPRLVWLRSREVSYSAEIVTWRLNADKTVDGMPGFTWEKWP